MRRQDEPYTDLVDQRPHLRRRPALGCEAVQRLADRPAHCACILTLPQYPDALTIFRDIDQLEVVAKRFGKHGFLVKRRIGDQVRQTLSRVVVTVAPGFGRRAYSLDQLKGVVAVLLFDDGAQQAAKKFDIRAQAVCSSAGKSVISYAS